jgi:hypothetical protein
LFFCGKNIEEEEDQTMAMAVGAALEDAEEYAWRVRSLRAEGEKPGITHQISAVGWVLVYY